MSGLQAYRRRAGNGSRVGLGEFLLRAHDVPRTVLSCLRRADNRLQRLRELTGARTGPHGLWAGPVGDVAPVRGVYAGAGIPDVEATVEMRRMEPVERTMTARPRRRTHPSSFAVARNAVDAEQQQQQQQ